MAKIDYKEEYAKLYKQPKGEINLVEVPPLTFLIIDGKGDPNTSQEYQEAIEALYSCTRQENGRDPTWPLPLF